jgi:hypothetical protein
MVILIASAQSHQFKLKLCLIIIQNSQVRSQPDGETIQRVTNCCKAKTIKSRVQVDGTFKLRIRLGGRSLNTTS